MAKIDFLIFGYRKIKIAPSDLSLTTEIFLRASVPSIIFGDGSIIVRERDIGKIEDLLSGRVEFSCSIALGVMGYIRRMKHKLAILVSLVISLILTMLLSGIVWDVRIVGNENITDGEITISLAELGFEIGDMWREKELGKIETEFLNENENISWININRRGVVAYVSVIEKKSGEGTNADLSEGPSNIVSNSDCVIEEITVKRGIAVVKPGDVVKKGDLLVAGILPEEAGGGFCNAEATVIGRVNDSVMVEVERNSVENYLSCKKLYSYTIKIFKISINIFKLYGNLTKEYVIIEDEITYSLFNKCKLPICVNKTYIVEDQERSVCYTDEELIKIASSRLNALVALRLEKADLLKIKTEGAFIERGYYIRSDMVFVCQVGNEEAFEAQ